MFNLRRRTSRTARESRQARHDSSPPATAALLSPPPPAPFARTKDVTYQPVFRDSELAQWLWRLFTQRVTQAGRWFLALTALLTMVGSLSLEVQTYIPFLYASAFWGIAVVALWVSAPRVRIRADHADRITAGGVLPVDVEVESPPVGGRRLAADLNVMPFGLPPAVDAVPTEGVPVGTLERGQTARLKMGLYCPRRGVYRLPGYRVETDFPFGLLNAYRLHRQERSLLVFPSFTRLGRLEIPTGRRYQPGGVALASKMGESFEYLGNREYREGDNVRDIDWRATARMAGQPIIREWREEYFLRVAVILDTHIPPLPSVRHGQRRTAAADRTARREAFERAVSLTAAVTDYMARQEYLVDLFAAGPNLYHLTAGRSLAYLEQILEILACVEESRDEPFKTIEPPLHEHLSQITSVVCIFLDWTETRQAFVEGLRQGGAGVKTILVRDTPPTLPPPAPGADFSFVDTATFAAGIEAL